MSDRVRVNRIGPVTVVEIVRPAAKNAVDRVTAEELASAFRAFDADPAASVGVLTGEGGVFSAGADLKAIARGEPNRVDPQGDGPMGPTRLLLSKPVIAAIEGFAVAGGLELALWCDLRVASEDAQLGVLCRRWGVSPDRWWHRPPPPHRGDGSRDGPHPHGARDRRARGGGDGAREPRRPEG
jgi:enoyl-CoA hydratase